MRICPHPLSRLWGREASDVFLSHSRFLPVLPRQEAGGVGRVDAGDALPRCPAPLGGLHDPQNAPALLQVQAPAPGGALTLRMSEEEFKPVPSKGWAAMIRKVYEVDPMRCPKCGGSMKVVAFITDYAAVDRIIDHLKLTFVAEKPPPSRVLTEVALMAAEQRMEYFL